MGCDQIDSEATCALQIRVRAWAMSWLPDWLLSNLLGTIATNIFFALIAGTAITAVANRALDKVKTNKEKIWFVGGTTLVFFIVLLYMPEKYPKSNFIGQIMYLSAGGDIPTGNPAVTLVASILNNGYAQSIAGNISLSTDIDGRHYDSGPPIALPNLLYLQVGDSLTTFCGKDSLHVKSSSPISPGSIISGVEVFEFHGVTKEMFGRPQTFTLHFQDVFGKKYTASIDTQPNAAPLSQSIPGVTSSTQNSAHPLAVNSQSSAPDIDKNQIPLSNQCS